jgi:hypothetical protein
VIRLFLHWQLDMLVMGLSLNVVSFILGPKKALRLVMMDLFYLMGNLVSVNEEVYQSIAIKKIAL